MTSQACKPALRWVDGSGRCSATRYLMLIDETWIDRSDDRPLPRNAKKPVISEARIWQSSALAYGLYG